MPMRLSRCILLLFWLFSTLTLVSQSRLDSLKDQLSSARKKNDRERIASLLSHIGYHFNYSLQSYDSALYYYKASISPLNFSTDNILNASTYNGIATIYERKGSPDSSVRYSNLALEIYRKVNDTTNIILAETNLSRLYVTIGLYEKGQEIAFDAIDYLEKKQPGRPLANFYNTIGDIYSKMSDYKNSLTYYRKALSIRKEIGYTIGVGISYNNIGEAFIDQSQYDSALVNLSKAEEIKKKANTRNSLGTTLNLIGKSYLGKNELTKAESYLREALKIKKESGERPDEGEILNNLGELKLKEGNVDAAEQFLNDAESLAREIKIPGHLRQALELKIKAYKLRGNFAKAMDYADELFKIKDSLLNQETAERLVALQVQYETEKKEQKIKILERDKALQKAELQNRLLLIIGLAAAVAFAVYGYRQSIKNKTRVENLYKELNHRIKNNLQVLSSVLSLQSQHLTDESAVQAMKSAESRVNAMMIIHKRLYGSNLQLNINIKEYLSELLKDLIHSYGYTQSLQLNFNCAELRIDVDEAIPIGLIVNELASNALKHAFHNQQNPQLHISLSDDGKGELKLTIRDNGSQAEKVNFESPQSFGLKMVNTLIKELRGSLDLNYKDGSEFVIQVPIN